jgi:hypothetical protein
MAFAAFVVLVVIGFLVLEALTRVEEIRKRVPWFVNYVEGRKALTHLVLICILMLVGNGYEILTKEIPEVPNPPTTIVKAPLAPTIQVLTVPVARESRDSLRRRTLRLVNELDAYGKERGEARMTISTTRDSKGQIPALNQYDSETITMYVSRGMKERTLGIVGELKAKGLDTGYLESAAEQRPLSSVGGFGLSELGQLRELAYHLDVNGNVVRIDD